MKSKAYREKYKEWESVKKAISDIVEGGASSASISSGAGSKSYTRLDLGELRKMEAELRASLYAIDTGVNYARMPKSVKVIFK